MAYPSAAIPSSTVEPTESLGFGKLDISSEAKLEEQPGQEDGWGEGRGWSSWDDGEQAVVEKTQEPQDFWESGPTKSEAASQDGWGDGWEEKGKQQEAAQVLDFPPGSPSACLPDESYGADYVDEGFLERHLEIFGQKLTATVAYTAAGVERWLEQCSPEENMFGFDLEWQPNRHRGDDNLVALLQLSLASRCLIVQLLHIDRIPARLEVLLADAKVKLGGVGVRQDVKKLEEDHGLKCRGEVDLSVMAVSKGLGSGGLGLAALSQSILGMPYKKHRSLTCSNWALEGLSFRQIQYAASDAWLSYALLVTLTAMQLDQEGDLASVMDDRARDVAQVAAFLKEQERICLRLLCHDNNSSSAELNVESPTEAASCT